MFGWKRSSDIFYLTLNYGTEELPDDPSRASTPNASASGSPISEVDSPRKDQQLGFRVDLEWSAGDQEDQVMLKLQSQLIVALPSPQDLVTINLRCGEDDEGSVGVEMKVVRRREPLRGVLMTKAGTGQSDGLEVLLRLFRSNFVNEEFVDGPVSDIGEHWRSITLLSLCGCGILELPAEIIQLPLLENLYLDYNRLSTLPDELGQLKNLKVLSVDYNMLISVPDLRECVGLVELSLEFNKLIRPLLDFRAMAELQILRLFGNPMEFLPEILPLKKLCHLTLANIRIVADENFRAVNVQIEMENSSLFGASRQKLSAFLSLILRFSSCHHPLLASALAKIMEDQGNCVVIGKDENAVRQLISMITSDNRHVVEQACSALSSLAENVSLAMQLMKCDIMKPIEAVLKSDSQERVIPVLRVLGDLAFVSDTVAQKMLTKDMLKSLKLLCAHNCPEVQRLALLAVGNLAFCLENRHILVTSESLRDLLSRLTVVLEPRVNKAAARALAILGENESLRRAIKQRQVPNQGLRILAMDGGGMKGLATVQILKLIEKGTGKHIHEMFDLICGTSTGGMLAVALGIKLMTLGQCEEIYKNLGKLVFAEPRPRDNESASWREKLDQLYKSSSQSFRVVVHGSKHSADQFERLLKEMCADEDGDLLIDSAVKNIPKVFVVSTLVSMTPAQPFIFRNYQYPVGTPEVPFATSEGTGVNLLGSSTTGAQIGYRCSTFIGSCKHHIWKAIRASSAAPYYLDDFSDDVNRWQDGAIVANNPTIFSIREAQLLWPGTKIDCLVSIGCGSVPAKMRKGGWRYLDTGQVLIESACSVDRVEEALSSLLQMLPDVHYFRFNPVDERCDMELDETDPAEWLKLEAAVDEYMQDNYEALENLCERLVFPFQNDETFSKNLKAQELQKARSSNADKSSPSLGWRRNVLLVEALHKPDSGRMMHHARALESFCAWNGIRLSLFHGASEIIKTGLGAFPSPFNSTPITGAIPSTSHLYRPDFGPERPVDMASPLSFDATQHAKETMSPPMSPLCHEQFSLPVQSLHDKLQNSPQVGIIHLALQNDSLGSILSWQNDVLVVAEPGDLADKFLQSVKLSMLSMSGSSHSKLTSLLANVSTIADLVHFVPQFQVGNVFHHYIGRQTQVMENDQEIAAYMFRRTVPSTHLKPDDVRWMVGSWRERIIVFTGTYGPNLSLIKAFLDSGAMAVICPPPEPDGLPQMPLQDRSGELSPSECGRYETGEEDKEEDDNEPEPASPARDKEQRSPDKRAENSMSFWENKEEELSKFVCELYHSLFRDGARVDDALRKALESHPRLRYSCHLPRDVL